MKVFIVFIVLLASPSCNHSASVKNKVAESSPAVAYDSHVHLMSPYLVQEWMDLGIPFSQTKPNYSDIDTILANNAAKFIDLIGMAYVYGSPEFYQGNEEYKNVQRENDYLYQSWSKYPGRIRPFFAVDPLKEYALQELKRSHEKMKTCGVKLHFSSSQVYLTEPEHLQKVKPIFAFAAENQLPLLLHFDNWHPKFGPPDIQLLLSEILVDIPALELRIAHFGTSGGFNSKTKRFLDAFIKHMEAGDIPEKHNIRFDISAVALDKDSEGVSKLTKQEFETLKSYVKRLGAKHIIFGSDYPLYRSHEYLDILKEKLLISEEDLELTMDNSYFNSDN